MIVGSVLFALSLDLSLVEAVNTEGSMVKELTKAGALLIKHFIGT